MPTDRHYELHLRLGAQRIDITAKGELDLSSVADLRRLLESTLVLTAPVWCNLSEVTFLDTAALETFVQATRTRRATGVPICLHPRSAVVQRVISLHGLGERSVLKLAGWDTLRAIQTMREPHYRPASG